MQFKDKMRAADRQKKWLKECHFSAIFDEPLSFLSH